MNHFLIKTAKYLAIVVFSLMGLIWLLSPQIANHFIQQQLKPQSLALASQSNVRYNPFLSTLSVEDFAITKNKKIVLAIKNLDVGISLYQLLFDKIYIKQFELDGLFIKLRQDKSLTEIAGFTIPKSEENQTAKAATTESVNYQLVLPLLKIENAKIGYESDTRKLEFITRDLRAKKIVADSKNQMGEFQLKGKLEQGAIALSGKFDLSLGQGIIDTELDVTKLDLSLFSPWIPAPSQLTSGLMHLSGQQKIHLIADKTEISLKDSQLQLEQLALTQDKVALTIDQQELYAADLSVQIGQKNNLNITGQGKYTLDHFTANNTENNQQILASVNKITLPVINIATPELAPVINLPTIDIHKVLLSDELTTELPPLLAIEKTLLANVNISADKTEIDNIALSGLVIDTFINEDMSLENLAAINSISPNNVVDKAASIENSADTADVNNIEQPKTKAKREKAAVNDYQFSLNQFSVSDPATIHLTDSSIKPNYKRQYTINKLTLGPIDTQLPKQETILALTGVGNEHEKFGLTSSNLLFAEKPSYGVKGFINEVDLSAVSPYIKDALKHGIKSGQVNLDIDAKVNGGQLSGDADIVIRHITFATEIEEAHDSVNTTASMPLNIAIDMLKDSSGNVELSFPLSGDVNSPEFGLVSLTTFLVKKASMMAAKDYLMTTFVPYANVVSIAMTAADVILKVRFNDLNFAPKQTEVSPADEVFLGQFSQLLIDKPDTHITICPIAVPEDINLKSGTEIKDAEQIEQLNKISRKRFNLFKNLMHEKYKIKTARLILCTPSIDSSEKAKPRLSFTS
ncbi:MAG: DUF748 domain-containing protein [Thalassotalea sp.]